MRQILRLTFIIGLLSILTAQSDAQPLRTGEWRTYTSMRLVRDVAVTSNGRHMWAATEGGAFRTDLSSLEVNEELRNTNGLTENELSAVGVDDQDNAYLGGVNGSFDIYEASSGRVRQERSILDAPEFPTKRINDIHIAGQRVYLATGYGLTIYNRSTRAFGETVTAFANLSPQQQVLRVVEARDTIFVVLTNAVAYAPAATFNLSNPSAWASVASPQGDLTSIAAFKDEMLVGSTLGLFRLDTRALRLEVLPGFDSLRILDLAANADSVVALEDNAGGHTLRFGSLSSFYRSYYAGLIPGRNVLTSLSMLPFGAVIAGTSGSGVSRLQEGRALDRTFPQGPVSNLVEDLAFDPNGILYTANGDFGVSVYQPSEEVWTGHARGGGTLPDFNYRTITVDSIRNVVWFGLRGSGVIKASGLTQGTPTWTRYSRDQGLPPSDPGNGDFVVVGQGMIDAAGNFAFTTWSAHGLGFTTTRDGSTFKNYSLPGGFHPYGTIAQDQSGTYWIGTERLTSPAPYGLFYYTPSGKTAGIIGGQGGVLGSRIVSAMIVDQDNALWVGTDLGLDIIADIYKASSGSNQNFTANRRIPFLEDQIINAIAVDGVGNKWVGTENGIFVTSPDGTDSVARFTSENSPLIDNNVIAIAFDAVTGDAYIGTQKGISRVNTIFKEGLSDYAGMKVYPNPVFQPSDEEVTVFVSGLVSGSTVGVYTSSGRLVAQIDGEELGSVVTWNGRDQNGNLLPSGVYLVSATSESTKERGQSKLVLIRK